MDEDLQDIICTTPVLIYKTTMELMQNHNTEPPQPIDQQKYQTDLEKQLACENEDNETVADLSQAKKGRKPLELTREEREERIKAQNKARKQKERERKRLALTEFRYNLK